MIHSHLSVFQYYIRQDVAFLPWFLACCELDLLTIPADIETMHKRLYIQTDMHCLMASNMV
jgi:hypothetical protein